MAHNFRQNNTGLYYSKAGHASNPGTKDQPRLTPTGSGSGSTSSSVWNVCGSGEYLQNINTTGLFADGLCVFRAPTPGVSSLTIGGADNSSGRVVGFNTSYLYALFYNYAFNWSNGFHAGVSYSRMRFISCSGSLSWSVSSGRGFNTSVCQWINSSMTGTAHNQCNGAILINSTVTSRRLVNSYLDINSLWIRNSEGGFSVGIASLERCNIQGLIQISGNLYAIKDQFTGTPQDNGYDIGVQWLDDLSEWETAAASCYNRDPKFNDIAGEDFTHQSDSPHIRRAIGNISNITFMPIAQSVINTDHDGVNIFVEASEEIDTSIPLSYKLNTGEVEGAIDYIFNLGGIIPLERVDLKAELKFNSAFAGGSGENNNVPDSEPLTESYASKTLTTLTASEIYEIVVPAGLISTGQFVRVLGEIREVIGVTNSGANDIVEVSSDFRAIVGTDVIVTFGSFVQHQSLNPNRLNYMMRVSTGSNKPVVDSDWDNDLDPSYEKQGVFFQQEFGLRPRYGIEFGEVYGYGDPALPSTASLLDIEAQWIHIRVYLRNNYSSNGF
jgi:hypothetical protein